MRGYGNERSARRPRRVRPCGGIRWLAFGAMLIPTAAPAQTEVVVSDEIACNECEITLTPVATLGKLEDDVALSMSSEFAVDPRGRQIYAALTYLPGAIVAYDWRGDLKEGCASHLSCESFAAAWGEVRPLIRAVQSGVDGAGEQLRGTIPQLRNATYRPREAVIELSDCAGTIRARLPTPPQVAKALDEVNQ